MAISMHRRHDISDALWNKPEPHLSGRKGSWRAIVVEKPDYEWLIIDASHIKVHPHVAGAKSGKSRYEPYKKGLNTTLHLAVDVHGIPGRVIITEGSVADCTQATTLIKPLHN